MAAEQLGPLRLVTVASDHRPELDALIDSAAAVGMEVTVLGMGQEWRGLGSKIKLLQVGMWVCRYMYGDDIVYMCVYRYMYRGRIYSVYVAQ